MNNWYVYRHIRLDKNQPFYIGIGNKVDYARAYEFKADKRNNIWNAIYHKTQIEVDILFDNITKQEAANKEKEFIKLYGRIDNSNGILSNMTDGGDGILNAKRSLETREKLRQGKLGSKNPSYGKKQSLEQIEKRRSKCLGLKRTQETKNKQSLASIKSGQAKRTLITKLDGTIIGIFHSLSEGLRFINLDPKKHSGKAGQVTKNIRNHCQGYKFQYV
jgi:hypothetical protein